MEYPARGYLVAHPHDASLQTFRGHVVSTTLVRAYFSPAATTAQRYVYAGSADGAVRIWDIVSGKEVAKLAYHREIVRDCSWHPTQPLLATTRCPPLTLCHITAVESKGVVVCSLLRMVAAALLTTCIAGLPDMPVMHSCLDQQ